ncbi:MAG: hypothetical protein PHI05_01850 [Bacilli bacterium]|nr:hypothetical protein [Bacilli bacterium]
MKRLLIVLVLFLTACRSSQELAYHQFVSDLEEINKSSGSMPFDVEISVNKLTDMEFQYNVIIDQPDHDIKDMRVLVVHNAETDSIFPSVGIVDKKVDLVTGNVDVNNNLVKGIALVGYLPIDTDPDITFKVMVEYNDEQNKKILFIISMR